MTSCMTCVCVFAGLQCVHALGLCLYLAVDDPRVRMGLCEGGGLEGVRVGGSGR